MNNTVYDIDYIRSLPPVLKNDKNMLAIAEIVAEQLQKNAKLSKLEIIYTRIDELSEDVLDILAYDFHVDWYDYSFTIEQKRRILKNSVKVHKRLGTKYAVETALGDIFPGTKIKEWFEYNGNPYTFCVFIDVSESGLTEKKQKSVLERIKFYKNLRSHLDSIKYTLEKRAELNVCAYSVIGSSVEVYPYRPKDIEKEAKTSIAAITFISAEVEILGGFENGRK